MNFHPFGREARALLKRLVMTLWLLAGPAWAAESAAVTVALSSGGSKGGSVETIQERSRNPERPDRAISGVTEAELTISFPGEGKPPWPAVLICPGGGYGKVVIDKEGHEIARWLNQQGFAAAVLKYRIPIAGEQSPSVPLPIQDGIAAMQMLRNRAAEWNLDTGRIGIFGSSAGGHLAASVATQPDFAPGSRPDFQVLLYPVISMEDEALVHQGSRTQLLGESSEEVRRREFSADRRVTAQTPPALLVHAEDDKAVPVGNSLKYRSALEEARVPVELIVLKTGGHGFGLGVKGGEPATWPERGAAWLRTWSGRAP